MSESKQDIRRPQPIAEPPAPPPGGASSVPGVGGEGPYSRVPRDPDPRHNPATDVMPAETTEPEDTDTEATKGGPEMPAESEPPA